MQSRFGAATSAVTGSERRKRNRHLPRRATVNDAPAAPPSQSAAGRTRARCHGQRRQPLGGDSGALRRLCERWMSPRSPLLSPAREPCSVMEQTSSPDKRRSCIRRSCVTKAGSPNLFGEELAAVPVVVPEATARQLQSRPGVRLRYRREGPHLLLVFADHGAVRCWRSDAERRLRLTGARPSSLIRSLSPAREPATKPAPQPVGCVPVR